MILSAGLKSRMTNGNERRDELAQGIKIDNATMKTKYLDELIE